MKPDCPPGSHPHADRPNWRPAETVDEYLANVREGLETLSQRRFAELMGVSRVAVYRWVQMAAIPDDLLERLMRLPRPSTKALAQVGQLLNGKEPVADVERCPHCDGVVRVRGGLNAAMTKEIQDWLREKREGGEAL